LEQYIPTKNEKSPKRGDDVHLTIDSNIQVFVEEALDDMVVLASMTTANKSFG
jgi:cell division protein FtsI/penicillin-binding protein 2